MRRFSVTSKPTNFESQESILLRVARLSYKTPFQLKSHHARPVRRRHVASLGIFVFVLGVSALAGLNHLYDRYDKELNARLTAQTQKAVQADKPEIMELRSTLGYGFGFNPSLLDVVANEVTSDGQLRTYDSKNVATPRPYAAVQIVPAVRGANSGSETFDRSTMTIITPEEKFTDSSAATRQRVAAQYAPRTDRNFKVALTQESTTTLGGVEFLVQVYSHQPKYPSRGSLNFAATNSRLYSGILPTNQPIVIKIEALTPSLSPLKLYEQLLGTFSTAAATQRPAAGSAELINSHLPKPRLLSLAERLSLQAKASAVTPKTMNYARIVATNLPAVVKIYHIVCGAVLYRDQTLLEDGCDGSTGSGFFISDNGYIATNGHVVSAPAKDIVANSFNTDLFARMLQIEGYSKQEITTMTADVDNNQAAQATVLQAIVKLDDKILRYQNQKDYYVVALGSDVPDFKKMLESRDFRESSTIKRASLVAIDYNFDDLYSDDGFTGSDVALLKLEGNNYPTVRLGSLSSLVQGASVMVIGFPGKAELTNLIKNDRLQATATQGIVSAIRDSSGIGRKIVQSDVAIGLGNSGGPAFDSSGSVFGIATYLLSDKNNADSDISYLRDIEDLKNLLRANSVTLSTTSASQTAWEAGLDAFYKARYTDAIAKFSQARALYSPNPLTSQYIDIAKAKIANGEEAGSGKVLYVIIGALGASLVGAGAIIVLMVRHRAHYHMFHAVRSGYIDGPLVDDHVRRLRHSH